MAIHAAVGVDNVPLIYTSAVTLARLVCRLAPPGRSPPDLGAADRAHRACGGGESVVAVLPVEVWFQPTTNSPLGMFHTSSRSSAWRGLSC